MLDEDIGPVAREQVAHHAAAHAGDHRHKQHQKQVFLIARANGDPGTVHRKNAQPGRVGDQHQRVVQLAAVEQHPPHHRGKHEQRRDNGHQHIFGIQKSGGRGQPQQQIPQNAAAHGGGHAQHAHAEDIHIFLQPGHRAGKGERHRAYDLQNQDEQFHDEASLMRVKQVSI